MGLWGFSTFLGDLLWSSVVVGLFFSKERVFLSMGAGTATLAFQPIPFDGTFNLSEVRVQLGGGGNPIPGAIGQPVSPLTEVPVPCTDSKNSIPEGCQPPRIDALPEVEVFDRSGDGAWVRLPRLESEATYALTNPTRYVDPMTGRLLVRFVNDNPEMSANFGFQVAIVGTVE
jgi:hypothetical protein